MGNFFAKAAFDILDMFTRPQQRIAPLYDEIGVRRRFSLFRRW
jgi:hypothetical protein